ncbi:zinc ribbon domain-containing protein [Lichenicoccus sp.]|uniref:zinc ribbon domain-containing protein n=1 Tax=Lichenicoccus sp. TaxID=2781899 RepID=UPI003D0DCFBA
MPSYHYLCADCGPFEAAAAMADFAQPAVCPECGSSAPRSLAAPSFAAMPGSRRRAFETNERSAHAPLRAHAPGCGCCKPKGQAGAAKSFPGARPWMISH